MKLTRGQRTTITDTISDIYWRLQARLLGRFFTGPSIYFSVARETDPLDTLEGAYVYTLKTMYGADTNADPHEVESLIEIARNYLESDRLKRLNRILTGIAAVESGAEARKVIEAEMKSAETYTDMVVQTEVRQAQAYAERAGISQLAATVGDHDPTVVKLGVVDSKICKNCKELWHSRTNLFLPRPWKLSELSEGYNKDQKNPIATVSGSHPRCRHILSYIPIGYTFSASGIIEFQGFGYDYYNDYYHIHKNEIIPETLIKACSCD